jgi:Ni/Fe-hydrogenase 1 B-type cytochrome subunit
MLDEDIKRARVWSAPLRFAHWTLAATTLALLSSGWLLSQPGANALHASARALHLTAGYLLCLALFVRLYLLFFGKGPAHWRDFLPSGTTVHQMLLFYITAGRMPLPAYYAHNPLWGPLYLVLFAVLTLTAASGLALALGGPDARAYYEGVPVVFGYTTPDLHAAALPLLAAFALLHLIAVFMHDWRGRGTEVSAMISGDKMFARQPANALQRDARVIAIKPSDVGKRPGR